MSTRSALTETNIIIRDIESPLEIREVEDLQREVWGLPDLDIVPFSHLVAAKAAGGVLLGAFDGGVLVGFAYGFVSYEQGQLAHHSHMLAVKSAYRNSSLGYSLKLAQRERIVQQGIGLMSWTFDPLQSLNAYFNFSKLGVVADRYLINFYGEDAASFLHRNGTDRLWVSWYVTSERVKETLAGNRPKLNLENTPALIQIHDDHSPYRNAAALSRDQVTIEIPADINSLQEQSANLATDWREATRWAFTEALAGGYAVVDFQRQSRGAQQSGAYVLTREKQTLN